MQTSQNLAVAASPSSKPRVLICDDDVEYSQELVEALGSRGFQAASVLTISAARAAILSPSILLLDLCMPERSGLEIAKILSQHARRDYFKIVLITGCSEQIIETVSKQFANHGLNFLGAFQKPVDLRRLCDLLDTVTP